MAPAPLLFDHPPLTGGGADIKMDRSGHEDNILPNPVSLQMLGTLMAAYCATREGYYNSDTSLFL
jgi:hypothetical protein